MATELATAYLSLVPSLDGANRAITDELSRVNTTSAGQAAGGRFRQGFSRAMAGLGAAAAAVGVGRFIGDSITAASDLGESVNAVNVTFGDAADGVLRLGENAADSLGLSNEEFNGLAVRFSSFASTIAGPSGYVTSTLDDMTTRAADFASVMNLDVNEAAQLFQSGLAGETEPLRQFGIDMSAAAVEAFAYANGIAESGTELTEAQKVQARYGLLMESTAQTQGDFANTSGSLANQQRILSANWEDLQATLGNLLIPVLERLTSAVRPAINFLAEHQGVLVAIGVVIGGILVAAFIAWTASIWAATAAMLANPVTWIVVGVIALVAALVLLIRNWDKVVKWLRSVWASVLNWLRNAWDALVGWFRGIPGKIERAIAPVVGFIREKFNSARDFVRNTWDSVVSWFQSIPRRISSALSAVAGFVRDRFNDAKQAVIDIFNGIVDWVRNIPSRVGAALSSIGGMIRDAINGVIGGWNNLSFTFTVPSNAVTDFLNISGRGFTISTPNIPFLAEGGIVTAPTLAVVGEGRGPEAVIPLNRMRDFIGEQENRRGGESLIGNLTVHGYDPDEAVRKFGHEVQWAMVGR